jgi:hypothetical protein
MKQGYSLNIKRYKIKGFPRSGTEDMDSNISKAMVVLPPDLGSIKATAGLRFNTFLILTLASTLL